MVRRKIFISKPFETRPTIYGQGRNISSRRQIYLFPVRAERELANFGHADRDRVHFFKRCYRINGSTLHPSADISDLPSDIRVEISDSPCTGHKTRCASYKNIRKKWRDRRQARAILFPTIRGTLFEINSALGHVRVITLINLPLILLFLFVQTSPTIRFHGVISQEFSKNMVWYMVL